jgi:2-amino-4-hydroxy-6-hydroxymethyldihydropteridine diphosphokinase
MTDKGNLHTAIIGIGSNIDAEKNIQAMLDLLAQKVKILAVSTFRKTRPIGIQSQPEFTNGALKLETSLVQQELKAVLIHIENKLGRNRQGPKYGPRTIDLDIILWNGEVVDPDFYTREFIRDSVKEIQ